MKEYINSVLRPLIQGDGGEISFISRSGDKVYVQVRGECSKCEKLNECLLWCGEKIRADKGESVQLVPEIKKPFFWDN